jgi:hypothetical protein
LNKVIQSEFKVIEGIRNMIFYNKHDSFDPYLKKIEIFNLLKTFIARCVQDDMVDTELLLKLTHQVRLRKQMIQTAREEDVEDTNALAEVTVQGALFDLSRVDPNDIASALAEENQLLEDLQAEVADIKDDMLNSLDDLAKEVGEIKQHLIFK